MWKTAGDNAEMVKKQRQSRSAALIARDEDEDEPLYVREWMRALGFRAAKIARSTGINEGYLSEIVNRKKRNPSRAVIKQIAAELGIDWKALYDPPPAEAQIQQLQKLSPETLERLRRRKI